MKGKIEMTGDFFSFTVEFRGVRFAQVDREQYIYMYIYIHIYIYFLPRILGDKILLIPPPMRMHFDSQRQNSLRIEVHSQRISIPIRGV